MPTASSEIWALEELFAIFDVERLAEDRLRGLALPPRIAPGDQPRQLVEGSQILGQAIVAARRAESDRFVKSAHLVFARPASIEAPVELRLETIASGRSFSSVGVKAVQGERLCAQGVVLLDTDAPDCIRHDPSLPLVSGPEDASPLAGAVGDRELRLAEGEDFADPAAVGPARLPLWVRHARAPDDPAIRQALVADLCGPFTIGTAMRPHAGFGQAQAHRTLSTGVLSLTVRFHASSTLDGWLLYDHDALHAGRGLCDGKGRVFEQAGRLVASFEQEALLRPLPSGAAVGDGKRVL